MTRFGDHYLSCSKTCSVQEKDSQKMWSLGPTGERTEPSKGFNEHTMRLKGSKMSLRQSKSSGEDNLDDFNSTSNFEAGGSRKASFESVESVFLQETGPDNIRESSLHDSEQEMGEDSMRETSPFNVDQDVGLSQLKPGYFNEALGIGTRGLRSRDSRASLQIRRRGSSETSEERELRLTKIRANATKRRASETQEKREQRLEANRKRVAERRARELEEERQHRLADYRMRMAKKRALETEEQRQQRLAMNRKRVAERRAAESGEKRRERLDKDRERIAKKRAQEKGVMNLDTTGSDVKKVVIKKEEEEVTPTPSKEDRDTINKTKETVALSSDSIGERIAKRRAERKAVPYSDTSSDTPPGKEIEDKSTAAISPPMTEIPQCHVVSSSKAEMSNSQVVTVNASEGAAVENVHQSSPVPVPQTNGLTEDPNKDDDSKVEQPNLERHYNELLRLIGEIGRDVKPAYTNSKVSTDKLRKNIMVARGVLRKCLGDLEKLAAY